MDAFTITDVSDEAVNKMLDEKFYASEKMPDNPKSDYYRSPSARIIDGYKLLDNNCTTFVSDVLNTLGSKALETVLVYPFGFKDYFMITTKQRFVIPLSLQLELNHRSKRSDIIRKIR